MFYQGLKTNILNIRYRIMGQYSPNVAIKTAQNIFVSILELLKLTLESSIDIKINTNHQSREFVTNIRTILYQDRNCNI